jgi:hypothetical protein
LNPCAQFPKPEFLLKITREAEFEIEAIPTSKPELRNFIQRARTECIDTHMYFGFSEARDSASESRYGGFDVGVWASREEIDFIHSQRESIGSEKKNSTRLYRSVRSVLREGHLHCINIADRLDPDLRHASLGDFTHTWNAAHRKWKQESLYLVRLNHELAVRLLPVRGNLRQELVWRYACRCGEMEFLAKYAETMSSFHEKVHHLLQRTRPSASIERSATTIAIRRSVVPYSRRGQL